MLQRVLRNLTAEDRARQTPCAEFDGHDLAEHLFGSLTGLGAMAGAEVSTPTRAPWRTGSPVMAAQAIDAWRAAASRARSPVPAAARCRPPSAASILSVEFLLHGWDFAQTSGQQLPVSDEVVAYVQGLADTVVPAGVARRLRREVTDAGPTPLPWTGSLAFAGRTPVAP